MPFVSLVAHNDRPKFLVYSRSITKDGISQTIELELLGKHGAFDVELISTGAESADGDQVIWVAFSDVTKRKALQAEIKASRDELEIRVDERTSMLRTSELQIVSANHAFLSEFSLSEEKAVNQRIVAIGNGALAAAALQKRLQVVLTKRKNFENFEVEYDLKETGHRKFLMTGKRIPQKGRQSEVIILSMKAVT